MPISSPWTVTIRKCKRLIQETCQPVVSRPWIQRHLLCPTVCHPWTLDSGIPAGIKGLQHLCITASGLLGNASRDVLRQKPPERLRRLMASIRKLHDQNCKIIVGIYRRSGSRSQSNGMISASRVLRDYARDKTYMAICGIGKHLGIANQRTIKAYRYADQIA